MDEKKYCPICKKQEKVSIVDVCKDAYEWLVNKIKEEHPEWVEKDGACPKCIEYYKKLPDGTK